MEKSKVKITNTKKFKKGKEYEIYKDFIFNNSNFIF